MKNLGEDVVGLVVGDTITEADRIFKRELEQRIEDCGIKNQIVWMGFRSDIGDILAATDCVFVPSEEGLSLVAMEAMSAKRQVVTMNSSGAYELLNHAGCGTFYKEDDELSVTNAVKKVLETPNAEATERGYAFCREQTNVNYKKEITNLFLNAQSSNGGLRV